MQLVRFASIRLLSGPDKLENTTFHLDDIEVAVQQLHQKGEQEKKGELRLLSYALVNITEELQLTDDRKLIVPETARRQAEEAIESVANLLAVSERCKRSISSPRPTVAFRALNDQERVFLEGTIGMMANRGVIPDTHFRIKITDEILKGLQDRLDGISLLAEALAHNHATGRYHEFIRIFERAFSLPSNKVEKKLAQFLSGTDLGYSRAEVRSWLAFRHPATHADGLKTKHLVFESDVRYIIPRMEQAAYDVLFNKQDWRNSSQERRKLWHPEVATTSDKYDLRLTQGTDATFNLQVLDDFKRFSLNLSFSLPNPPAQDLWAKWAPDDN